MSIATPPPPRFRTPRTRRNAASNPPGRAASCLRATACLGVISENDVVQAFDIGLDEIGAFVQIGLVEEVADALEEERRLLDVDFAVGIDRAAFAAGDDPI